MPSGPDLFQFAIFWELLVASPGVFSLRSLRVISYHFYVVFYSVFLLWSFCCTPYIMDTPSSINIRQRERQTEFTNQRDLCASPVAWVTLQPAVLWTVRFRSGVPHHWRYLWPQGAVPSALTVFGGVRFIGWRLRHPGRVRATALWLDPPKNGLVPLLYAWWVV